MIQVEKLNFGYTDQILLKNLNFEIEPGQIVSVLGESGSGKSTLLKLIYGLLDLDVGLIRYENQKVTGPKYNLVPGHPDMKFVPQEFDLLDSITVAENVGKYLSNFNLPLKKKSIDRALEAVDLLDLKNEHPSRLSGGQRQRVAIARALATEPKVLLLDEPYSHLDQPLKMEIRKRIWEWARETGCSVILTTHDFNDALGNSDEVMVIKSGKLIQKTTPFELRNQPQNDYVASLLGPYSKLGAAAMKTLFGIEIPANKKAIIYPEELSIAQKGVPFKLSDLRFQGRDYLVEVKRRNSKLLFYSSQKPKKDELFLKLKNHRLV